MPPPFAPEPPPQAVPLSPTFTSSSSNTMNSSQTSYSSEMLNTPRRAIRHWAQTIFDGEHPGTAYDDAHQTYVLAHLLIIYDYLGD